MARPGDPTARLRALLDQAAADERAADPAAIAAAARDVFGGLKRTDMRSGVANIIRRLADLAATGDQPVSAEGWRILREAADLLGRTGVTPGEVGALDRQLQEVGLDVDLRPPLPPHQASQQNPN